MKNLYLILIALLGTMAGSVAQTFDWARQAGYHSSEASHSVSADAAGNCYITGEMSPQTVFDNITFGGTFVEGFVAKYDPAGTLLWATNITGPDTETPYHISADPSGNSYVTGTFNQTATFGNLSITATASYDAFLAKYDTQGNVVWAKKAGGPSAEYGSGAFADDLGNVVVCGAFYQSINFGTASLTSAGMDDVFLTMYDSSGNVQWAVRAGGPGADYANDVKIRNGLIYVTGAFQQTASFGSTTVTSLGHYDIFLACYDMNGNVLWSTSAGSNEFVGEAAAAVEVDQNGTAYICGSVGGTATFGNYNITSNGGGDYVDAFIAAYNNSGNCIWVKHGGGIIADGGLALAVDPSGLVYMSGSYNAVATFDSFRLQPLGQNSDIFLVCYNNTGSIQWIKNVGGGYGSDAAEGLCYDHNGGLFMSGFFYRSAYFDSINLPWIYNERNIFVARMDLPGSVGLNQLTEITNHMNVYPNPATSYSIIEWNALAGDENALIVSDVTGKVMLSTTVINDASGMGRFKLDTSELSSGLYFISRRTSAGIFQQQLVEVLTNVE